MRLRAAGIQIARFDPDLMAAVEELNREFARQHPAAPAPNLTSDKAPPALGPQRPTIREKSAAEILGNLNGITLSYRFNESVAQLYLGRWTREPGWQTTVYDLPSKVSETLWHCSFKEVGSGTLVFATTVQDVSILRLGDSVTVSGRIGGLVSLGPSALKTPSYGATMFRSLEPRMIISPRLVMPNQSMKLTAGRLAIYA